MKLILLLASFSLLSSPAYAWRESHGGDSIVADFIGRTNDIIRTSKFVRKEEVKKALQNISRIRDSILVVTTDRVFDKQGEEVPTLTKCDWQEHDGRMTCIITINRYKYLSLEKDSAQATIRNKEEVIVNEFSKILNISNESKLDILRELQKYNTVNENSFQQESLMTSIQYDTVKDFVETTTTILEDLRLIQDPKIKAIYNKILNAIPKTGYSANKEVFLDNVEKDAVNTCLPQLKSGETPCLIVINAPRWAQYNGQITNQADRKKEQLVLHEFLAIIQENDKDYMLSEKIINKLEAFRAKR